MDFNDVFGNKISVNNVIACGSQGMRFYHVNKMFVDKNGYSKMRVTELLLDRSVAGGFSVSPKKKYLYHQPQNVMLMRSA